MKSGDLSLADVERDKNTGDMVESIIAIYTDKLGLLSGVVSLLIRHAVFHKQIPSVGELTKLTIETASYCADGFKKLNDKGNW